MEVFPLTAICRRHFNRATISLEESRRAEEPVRSKFASHTREVRARDECQSGGGGALVHVLTSRFLSLLLSPGFVFFFGFRAYCYLVLINSVAAQDTNLEL